MLTGTVLDRVSSINNLGVIMDKNMEMSEQVDVIVGKVFAMLGFIIRVQRSVHAEFSLHVLGSSEAEVRQNT
jgi:hypothetical protein